MKHDLSSDMIMIEDDLDFQENENLLLQFNQSLQESDDDDANLMPNLLFSSNSDTEKPSSLDSNRTENTSGTFVTFNNHLAINLPWRSLYPHLLGRQYFENARSSGCWDIPNVDLEQADHEDYFFKRFDIIETLGKGSFADVFKVKCKDTGQVSAIKKTRHSFQGMKDRIKKLQEVENMFLVAPHPNILGIIESWEQYGCLYIQMEICDHGTLESIIESVSSQQGFFDEREIWNILKQVGQVREKKKVNRRDYNTFIIVIFSILISNPRTF
jgi:hypothetical protein